MVNIVVEDLGLYAEEFSRASDLNREHVYVVFLCICSSKELDDYRVVIGQRNDTWHSHALKKGGTVLLRCTNQRSSRMRINIYTLPINTTCEAQQKYYRRNTSIHSDNTLTIGRYSTK